MKKHLLFLCLHAILIIIPATMSACDCLMVSPVTSHVKTSEYILVVKTMDYEREEFQPVSGVRANVTVLEVLKGNVSVGQEIRFAADNPSNCSFRFEKDKVYLVFAFKKKDHFEVYQCSFSGDRQVVEKKYRQLKKYINRKGTSA
ncbi:hypothetical protein ACQKLP_15290 [Chitinophaga sp. NPDC101104]|uniref:hypothetical protein n=1 Tax=Chitinophaga sp. NPDC101104 TaxID=3390561 RepID=UPI003CFC90AC